jgi:hypothetical protein
LGFPTGWSITTHKEVCYTSTSLPANASAKNEPWVLASQVDQCFFITDPSKPSRVVVRRGKRSIIRMEGPANEQDLEKNDNPKIKEEFDKYFDKLTATGRRKTTLPTKGYLFTRKNLNIPGL